jgi:1,4-dihydroxy-2-naphthoate polyprenyltransferase
MSVAQGQQALDGSLVDVDPDVDLPAPSGADPAPTGSAAVLPHPARTVLPPRPPVPSSPSAWARAVRLRALPVTLLGGAVGGLLVARDAGARPLLLVLAGTGLVVAHALGGLARDLGDARPDRAGPLRRSEAGRAALGLAGAGTVLLAVLAAVRDPRAAAFAAAGCLAVLLAVSRRSGVLLAAVAGHAGGVVAVGVVVWAATGAVDRRTLLVGLVVGGPVAALLAARRVRVAVHAARLLVLVPYAAAGAAVALGALPWPVVAVALALPAARRTSAAAARADASTLVAGHARLFAALLVAGLLVAALTGTDLPRG